MSITSATAVKKKPPIFHSFFRLFTCIKKSENEEAQPPVVTNESNGSECSEQIINDIDMERLQIDLLNSKNAKLLNKGKNAKGKWKKGKSLDESDNSDLSLEVLKNHINQLKQFAFDLERGLEKFRKMKVDKNVSPDDFKTLIRLLGIKDNLILYKECLDNLVKMLELTDCKKFRDFQSNIKPSSFSTGTNSSFNKLHDLGQFPAFESDPVDPIRRRFTRTRYNWSRSSIRRDFLINYQTNIVRSVNDF